GANVGYLFGTLQNNQELQYPLNSGALNSKIENNREYSGFAFDYGMQYFTDLNDDLSLVIGYSGNAGQSIRSRESQAAVRTFGNSSAIEENIALDTVNTFKLAGRDVSMPMTHKVGFSLSNRNKWLVGADFNYGK